MPSDEALRNMTVIQLCELIEQMAAIIKEQQTQGEAKLRPFKIALKRL